MLKIDTMICIIGCLKPRFQNQRTLFYSTLRNAVIGDKYAEDSVRTKGIDVDNFLSVVTHLIEMSNISEIPNNRQRIVYKAFCPNGVL